MICLLALVAAIVAVRARTPDLMLEVTEQNRVFAPDGGGPGGETASFTFFLREPEPEARIEILGTGDEVVRVLDPAADLAAGEETTVEWDGRTDAGTAARPDIYRLRIDAPSLGRSMIWPQRVALIRGDRPASVLEELRERRGEDETAEP